MVTALTGPVCPETILDGMMDSYKETIPVFIRRKMRCIGCPIAHLHDVREACEEHHVPLEDFLAELNRVILKAGGGTP